MENQRTRELVVAALAENIFAGLGAYVVAWVCLRIYAGHAPNWVWDWALLVGLTVFGVLCVVRFSRDEVEKVSLRLRYEKLISLYAEAEATIAELRAELSRAQKRLRTQEFTEASKDAKQVVEADKFADLRRNVQEIVDRWRNEVSYSRDSVTMSKAAWQDAMQFLRDAGVLVRGGPGGRQWVFVDGATERTVAQAVAERFEKLEQHVDTNFVVA